jgi:hypothetical protein
MAGGGGQRKVCCACGIDVAHSRRTKDVLGRYYCPECYDRLSAVGPGGGSDTDIVDLPLASVDAEASPSDCPACGAAFTGDGVADAYGRTVCGTCFARMAAESAAATAGSSPHGPNSLPRGLMPRMTCPHCWHRFGPEKMLWVAQHADLLGDQVLGPEAPARFLPSRFTLDGEAVDARGMACQTLACPRCHLVVPRALIHTEPMILSIIGVPASGKSYLLAAMTWQLRREMPKRFALAFNDADTLSNRSLNDYEETLFLQHDDDKLVAIRKTEEQGELYDQIRLGQQVVSLPRPFLFTLRPSLGHPAAPMANRANKVEQPDRVLCMYDNAGESFQAGKDTTSSPVTQHVAKSRVLMFLFDPTQDPRFRQRCRAISGDPQLSTASRTSRQETILTEAALRVRRHAGLAPGQKYDRPLLVVVPKSDVWGPLLDCDLTTEPYIDNAVPATAGSGMPALSAVDLGRIATVSAKLRALLLDGAPEFVTAAEEFCHTVVYIPVSALGRGPEVQEGTGMLGICPRDIKPRWVTVPVAYAFAKWATGLIAGHSPPAAFARRAPARA